MSKQHQLQSGMYCIPETAEQASELLRFAHSLGFTLTSTAKDVARVANVWSDGYRCKKGVTYFKGRVYSMYSPEHQSPGISVTEFISRLKGEWNESRNKRHHQRN